MILLGDTPAYTDPILDKCPTCGLETHPEFEICWRCGKGVKKMNTILHWTKLHEPGGEPENLNTDYFVIGKYPDEYAVSSFTSGPDRPPRWYDECGKALFFEPRFYADLGPVSRAAELMSDDKTI